MITCPVRQFITCLRQNVTCLVSTYTLARPHTQQIGTKRQGGGEGENTRKKWKKKEKCIKGTASVVAQSWLTTTVPFILSLKSTGCPKKHGNSVTNSISSFQIILWFSIVIPTEKAVICKSFVCYVHICLFMFWLQHTVVLSKTRKLQYTNRVNLSVFTVHLAETLWTHLYSLLPFS